jgi:hypothetical protein
VQRLADSLQAQTSFTGKTLLKTQYQQKIKQLTKLKDVKSQYNVTTADNFSTLEVMEKAYPAEKEEPTRWYLIFGISLITFIGLVVTATIVEVFIKSSNK